MRRDEIRAELEAIWNDTEVRHPNHRSCWNLKEKLEGALGYWIEPNYTLVNSRGKRYNRPKGNKYRLPPRYPPGFWSHYGMMHRLRFRERYLGKLEVVNRAENPT